MSDARPKGSCVICGKPKDEKYAPFCSKHCADVDLNRWFSGGYAIPGENAGDETDDKPAESSDEE